MLFKNDVNYSTNIERATLGICVLVGASFGRVYGILEKECFYHPGHQLVFDVLKGMFQNGINVDILTVIDQIKRVRGIKEIEGWNTDYFVTRLTNEVVNDTHLEYHCHILKTMWMEREIINLTHSGTDGLGDNVSQKVKKLQDKLFSLQNKAAEHDWVDMTHLMVELYRHQDEIKKTGGIGIPTSFKSLDKENGGFQNGQLVVIGARPSMGKCLAKGTKVLMLDGNLKCVEDIVAGDKLMGVDSKERNVLSITTGVDEMYSIWQRNGVKYTVNSQHILSLKRGKTENRHNHGDVLNIKAEDFFKLPPSTQRRYKGYMSNYIDFKYSELPVEPYYFGLWLGDGRCSDHRITNEDVEIIDYCQNYATKIGMKLTNTIKAKTNCSTLAISKIKRSSFGDCLKTRMEKLGVFGNKHIPDIYLFNTKENRLKLLAGIIDSDGHVGKKYGTIEVTLKNKQLLLQVKFLCNTLGYRVSFKSKKATIKSIGYSCDVYKIVISGNTYEIPLKVSRKKNAVRVIKHRDASMTQIKVFKEGVGEYFGFQIDGDNLFLLEDCTVTHNSALVGGMAIEMSKRGKTVGIISLEMSNTEIAARLAAYDTDTDFNVVYRGLYRDMNETHRLYEKIGQSTSTLPIYVSDKTKVNIPEIRGKAEKLKSLHGLDCIMIDYLQLVSAIGGSYNKNRENEIAEMSRGCKIMAKELDIPVVLLCQLNREVTKRKGEERYPQLSDLRESGAIEQDADVVLFLHRDFMAGYPVDENGTTTERQADLVVRKWRNGRSNFIIPLDFDPPKMKFSERQPDFLVPVSTTQDYYESKKDDGDLPF